LEEAIEQLKRAHKEYKQAKKNAENWRSEFQDELADARAEKNNTTREKEIKRMKLTEKQTRLGAKSKFIRNRAKKDIMTEVHFHEDGNIVYNATRNSRSMRKI